MKPLICLEQVKEGLGPLEQLEGIILSSKNWDDHSWIWRRCFHLRGPFLSSGTPSPELCVSASSVFAVAFASGTLPVPERGHTSLTQQQTKTSSPSAASLAL